MHPDQHPLYRDTNLVAVWKCDQLDLDSSEPEGVTP